MTRLIFLSLPASLFPVIASDRRERGNLSGEKGGSLRAKRGNLGGEDNILGNKVPLIYLNELIKQFDKPLFHLTLNQLSAFIPLITMLFATLLPPHGFTFMVNSVVRFHGNNSGIMT